MPQRIIPRGVSRASIMRQGGRSVHKKVYPPPGGLARGSPLKAGLVVAGILLFAAVSGCVQQGATVDPAAAADAPALAPTARVVVADIDTGINPYHVEFRDASSDAFAHPSTYLAGFPADAPALDLTLDAPDYDAAVAADCAVWQSVEPGVLYWIPGTRIVGAISFEEGLETECDVANETYPQVILDPQGHGTMTASRVAGATTSLCPTCKIVFVQGFSAESMLFAAEQPYIDLQTNSWGALPTDYKTDATPLAGLGFAGNDREVVLQAAKLHPVFVAGGNGLLGFFGVTGHPAYLDDIAGPDGIIMVGGHDGGRFTPWTMTMPHVVADANWHPAAEYRTLDEVTPRTGGGTSGATPFAAGTMARMILEARMLAGDAGTGVRDGALVVATTPPAEGPMADGDLTIEEAKLVLFHTANPRPVRDGDRDGDTCAPQEGPGCVLYPTAPIEWGVVPTAFPAYYFVGYGQVGEVTLNATLAALSGAEPIPERTMEDRFYGFDQQTRRGFDA